jgi:hypothetical protein
MNFKEVAEDFLIAGLNPIPLKVTKAPNLPKDHNFLYETNTDFVQLDPSKTQGIGVVCGDVSEFFMTIDFDKHQGQDIYSVFYSYTDSDLFRHLINTNKVSTFKTPSGGFHIDFKADKRYYGKTLASYADGNVMIETRGYGQYAACFPMEGYTFIKGCPLTELKQLTEEEVKFLLDRCEIYNRDMQLVVKKTGSSLKDGQRKWPESWPDDTPDGIYNNNEVDSAKKLLVNAGWSRTKDFKPTDEVEYWVRPGKKEDDGISATFGFKTNMFYVFTDAKDAKPFKKGTAYSPFMIMVQLEYNGDWRKAKDDLCDIYNLPKYEHTPKVIPIIREDNDIYEDTSFDFPLDILPQDYQNYINATSNSLSFSQDFIACTMLMAISTCIGNKAKIKIKTGYIDSPIFWMAIVGSRGSNKTHPVKGCLSPLKDIEAKNFARYTSQLVEYNALSDTDKEKTKKPQFQQVMVSDFTIEALHNVLSFNKKGVLLYKDELHGFFKDMNKYKKSGGDEEFFLESFNNGSHTINRKTQDTVLLSNIFINIIGTIQDEILSKLAADHTENGLLDRFLFTKTERLARPLTANMLDPVFINWWNDKVNTINKEMNYSSEQDTIIFDMTPEAFDYLLTLEVSYTDIQNSDDTMTAIQTYYSKLRTYIKRFALLIMIIEHFDYGTELIIDDSHVKKAEKLITYFSKTATNVFISNAKVSESKEILGTLRGKSASEKINILFDKGYKKSEIIKMTGKSKVYVYKVLKDKSEKP